MSGWCDFQGRLVFHSLEKLGHPIEGLIAYAYRHSFATDALVNGVGIAQVVELLGHTSTEIVMRHNPHIAGRSTRCRRRR